jgi:DNA-directed RNA polymerase subunit RPC12/RpoP
MEIANCPKCGATVTVERWSGDDEKVMGFHCPTCGFMYLAKGDLTDEQNLAAWNSQPVIQRLRAEVEELKKELAELLVEKSKPKLMTQGGQEIPFPTWKEVFERWKKSNRERKEQHENTDSL